MGKKYSALIILVTVVFILNFIVIGTLVSQPHTQTRVNDRSISKVTVSVISTNPQSNNNISTGSTNTDKLAIQNVQTNLTAGSFSLLISNYDTLQVAITNIFVNDLSADLEKAVVIPSNSNIKLLLTLTDGIIFPRTYQISLLTSEGQSVTYYAIVD
jgi:hypothetical protein